MTPDASFPLNVNLAGIIACALLGMTCLLSVFGAVLPWATGPLGLSRSGVSGDGILTMGAGIGVLILGLLVVLKASRAELKWFGALLSVAFSAFTLLVAVYDGRNLQRAIGDANVNGLVSVGAGVYVTGFAGALGVIGGLLATFAGPRTPRILQSRQRLPMQSTETAPHIRRALEPTISADTSNAPSPPPAEAATPPAPTTEQATGPVLRSDASGARIIRLPGGRQLAARLVLTAALILVLAASAVAVAIYFLVPRHSASSFPQDAAAPEQSQQVPVNSVKLITELWAEETTWLNTKDWQSMYAMAASQAFRTRCAEADYANQMDRREHDWVLQYGAGSFRAEGVSVNWTPGATSATLFARTYWGTQQLGDTTQGNPFRYESGRWVDAAGDTTSDCNF